jgi:hypothetical protein
MPRLPLPLDRLPVREVAGLLLGPASAVRHGTVAVARTTRSWELTLAALAGRELDGEVPRPTHAAGVVEDAMHGTAGAGSSAYADDADTGGAQAMARAASTPQPAEGGEPEIDLTDVAVPPVEGWAEMSPQDAGAAVSGLSREQLDALIAYEEAHGRRLAYLLMLRQRRDEAASV